MDNVAAMITFAKVVETRSFSEAARRLGVSKSAVSKQVAKLEDRLGARLLNRTTRKLSPTDAGLALFERCVRIAAEVEEAELAVTAHAEAPRGTIRINGPVSFGERHLMPVIAEARRRYPELKVDLILNDRFVDMVDEGFDLVVRITSMPDSSLIARKLAPARRIALASPAYLQRAGEPLEPQDLVRHECLTYTYAPNQNEWRFVEKGGRAHTVRVSGSFCVNNGNVMKAALLEGLGIAVLPTFIVYEEILAGRLKPLFPQCESSFGNVFAVWPSGRHLSPKVRAMVDLMVERYGPEPYWDRCLEAGASGCGDIAV